jgi:hypothetical protein
MVVTFSQILKSSSTAAAGPVAKIPSKDPPQTASRLVL